MFNNQLRFMLIVLGFVLFLSSFFVLFEAINSSSRLLRDIKEKHYRFFTIAEDIRKDVLQHQSDVYLFLIYRHSFGKKFHFTVLDDVDVKLKSLGSISKELKINEASLTITSLHKRIENYKKTEKGLVQNFLKKKSRTSDDYLLEYKFRATQIHEVLDELTQLASQNFLNGVNNLALTVERSKHYIYFVLLSGLMILLVSFANLIRHNRKYASQLRRAVEAEKRQKELQEEVVSYSSNLEVEVAKKSSEVSYRYYHNSLTNLPNRLKLTEDIEVCKEPKLVLFNIDKFQHFNDYFGSKRGDNVIIFLANKLNYLTEAPLTLFHLSGDEFGVLGDDSVSKDRFFEKTMKIFEQIKTFEVVESENKVVLNITAGFALSSGGVFSKADIALKRAKQENRDYLVYDDKKRIRENFLKHLNQLRELSYAISRDRMQIYLQPICDAKSKAIEKYEVLVRMLDSKGEVLAPVAFLEVAKEAKLYPKITEIVFAKTMELVNQGKIKCSMNISIDDILNKKTRTMILKGLEKSDYSQNLTFELLESENIEKYDKVQDFINEVKALNAKLAIDDFGTGYSNFDHLMHLDVNFLKIDGSLVKGLEDDLLSQNFVRAMVGFAKELGIKTVAEYVASEGIYELLLDYGIDYVQGYWLGKPEPVSFYIK